MNISNIVRVTFLILAAILLAGCAGFRTADNGLDAAAHQLATKNTTLNSNAANVPDAAITSRGDFLIDGKSVAITPQQRKEMLAYRAEYIEIAQQGIAIAHEGVDAGRRAMVPMVFAALFGASDKTIDTSMDKRLAGVRDATAKLCDRLPALRAAQQRLAADLPEFEPYAILTPKKIGECRNDALKGIAVAQQ